MKERSVIALCGITYQPLIIGLRLLQERHGICKLHVLTTSTAIDAVSELLDAYFPRLSCQISGAFVSGNGTAIDQAEFEYNVHQALADESDPVVLIASGTNWMMYHLTRHIQDREAWSVRTLPEFQEKSFTPENEQFTTDSRGRLLRAQERQSWLTPLGSFARKPRIRIEGRDLFFLDHRVRLTIQEAAMFAYLLHLGGIIELDHAHEEPYNQFCESRADYDNYRVMLDDHQEFAERFRQNVSKINGKLADSHEMFSRHLYIERNQQRYQLRGMLDAAAEWNDCPLCDTNGKSRTK